MLYRPRPGGEARLHSEASVEKLNRSPMDSMAMPCSAGQQLDAGPMSQQEDFAPLFPRSLRLEHHAEQTVGDWIYCWDLRCRLDGSQESAAQKGSQVEGCLGILMEPLMPASAPRTLPRECAKVWARVRVAWSALRASWGDVGW